MCASVGSSSCWISFIGQVGICPGSDRTLTDRPQSPPDDKQGRGIEDRAVGARDDPDQQGQHEALQGLPTEEQQRHQHQDDGELVMIERAAVCMMLKFTTCSKVRRLETTRFSRIRSKTTIVSWTEKPTTVSTAVRKKLSISPIRRLRTLPRIEKMPASRKTSCSKASRALPPNWKPDRQPPCTRRKRKARESRIRTAADTKAT